MMPASPQFIAADVHRYQGDHDLAALLTALRSRTFRVVASYRLVKRCQALDSTLGRFAFVASRILHRRVSGRAGIDLPWQATIGPGLLLVHGWGIVISEGASLGRNVTLLHGVTIGRADALSDNGRVSAFPTIGDEVWVGPGACILGEAHVGDGTRVLAGSVVVTSVEADAVVGGVPAKRLGPAQFRDVVNPADDAFHELNAERSTGRAD